MEEAERQHRLELQALRQEADECGFGCVDERPRPISHERFKVRDRR
jgi:hypothetical protein